MKEKNWMVFGSAFILALIFFSATAFAGSCCALKSDDNADVVSEDIVVEEM